MEQNDAASLSRWVADMNLDMGKNNSQMELVLIPIKFDEKGQGELIGEGDMPFHLQTLKSSESASSRPSIRVPTGGKSSLPVLTENKQNNRKEVLCVDGKIAECLERPEKDENENEVKVQIEDPVVEEAQEESSVNPHPHRQVPDPEQGQVNPANPNDGEERVEILPIDEVGVEARPEEPLFRRLAVRHNWRMLLFLLIIFILCYQLIDRYFINGTDHRSFSSFRSAFRIGGRGGD